MPALLILLFVLALSVKITALCVIEPDENGHVELPNWATIGSGAFDTCISLRSITIPTTVTRIYSSAFQGCTNLQSIELPNGLISIGNNAFYQCSSLKTLHIPDSVKGIDTFAFRRCTGLVNITGFASVTVFSKSIFKECTSLKYVEITDALVIIDTRAFEYCTSLETISLTGRSLKVINTASYRGCTSLNSVSFGTSLVTIGSSAFEGCTSLLSLEIPNSVTSVGDYAFLNCLNLEVVSFGYSLVIIGTGSFKLCKALTSPKFSGNVTTLGDHSFAECVSLTDIELPASITSVGGNAFGRSSITSLTIKNASSVTFGAGALAITSSLQSVNITASEVFMGFRTFMAATQLEEIYIDAKSTTFGDELTLNANGLRSLIIRGVTESVGDSAFSSHTSLETVVFEGGVKSIMRAGFYRCSSLRAVKLGSLLSFIGTSAFSECNGLTDLQIGTDAPVTMLSPQLCQSCLKLKSIALPTALTSIAANSFINCPKLTSVTFPSGSALVTIGTNAFRGDVALTSIDLPATLQKIDSGAFMGTMLTALVVPASMLTISGSAFAMCTKLHSLTINPVSLEIGYNAFDKAPLESVTILNKAMGIETEEVPNIWCDANVCSCNEGFGGAESTEVQEGTTCTACAPGSFAAMPRLGACSPCPVGTYGVEAGLTMCTHCAIGKSTKSSGATVASACEACGAGKYSSSPGSVCLPCETGSYHGGLGTSACNACPPGTYNANVGAISLDSCVECAPGKYSADVGASSSASCVECPAGLVPSSLTGSADCVIIPTSSPSSQPSSLPTTQPTGEPTSNPTVSESSIQTWAHDTLLSAEDIDEGRGLFFVGEHTFTNLGLYWQKYYLSLFVYDTGFGPVKAGEYVQFFVNDEVVSAARDDDNIKTEEVVMCAPVTGTLLYNVSTGEGCQDRFVPCAYNVDVTSQILSATGGSLSVAIKSYGVISSACPYIDPQQPGIRNVVYARYQLSAVVQATPQPSFPPTEAPTRGSLNVFNGLQLDINSLDVWSLLQICMAVGLVMGMGGAFLTNIRKKAEKSVYQHPLAYSAIAMGLVGGELTSMVLLVFKLLQYGFSDNAITLSCFRVLQLFAGGTIVFCLFGPASMQQCSGNLRSLVATDHLTAESKVYLAVASLCVIDVGFIVFLPWKDSRFAMLSKGFPCLWVWRVVNIITIVSVMVSLGCQIPFLLDTKNDGFSAERDLVFVLNIILLGIKTVFVLGEFYYKHSALSSASLTTSNESENDNELNGAGGTVKDGDIRQSAAEAGGIIFMGPTIHYTANPLFKETSASSVTEEEERGRDGREGEEGEREEPETASENDPLLSCRLIGMEQREARMEQQIAVLLGRVQYLERQGASGRPTSSSGGGYDGAKRPSLLISKRGPTDFVRRSSGAIEAVGTVMPSISGSGGGRAERRETLVQQVPAADIITEVNAVDLADGFCDDHGGGSGGEHESERKQKPQRHLSYRETSF